MFTLMWPYCSSPCPCPGPCTQILVLVLVLESEVLVLVLGEKSLLTSLPILQGFWRTKVPQRGPGQSSWKGYRARTSEAENNTANCTRWKSILCVHMASKRANCCSTKVCIKCRSTNILQVYQSGTRKARSQNRLRLKPYRYLANQWRNHFKKHG